MSERGGGLRSKGEEGRDNDNKMAEGAGTSTTTEKEKEGKRPPLYPVRFVWDHGGDDVSVVITAAPGGDVRTVKLRSFQEGHHEELIALNLGRYEYREVQLDFTPEIEVFYIGVIS